MQYLNLVDYTAVGVYFLILLIVGFVLSRRASASLEDYFLGGRKLPWWALGMSGTASWFDITGTMLIVSFMYMLGPRGIYIEFRGGACLVLAFMMVYSGKWHRRSGCITGAEWQEFRFGSGLGGQFARALSAISVIVTMIGMLAYMVKGVGGFLHMFFPWSPMVCALLMVSIATVYTMASGFYGVVVTDVIQTLIILIAVGVVAGMAVMHVTDVPDLDAFAQQVTRSDFPQQQPLREHWTTSAPYWNVPMQKGYEEYRYLIMFALFYLLKNTLQGMSSGADPRYFGARNERECGLLSAMWGGLIMVRWPMMIAFAVLGLFLVNDYFHDKPPDVLKQAQVLIKREMLAEAMPEAEVDFDAAARVEEIVPKAAWADVAERLGADPQTDAALAERLQTTLGPQWPVELRRLADQQKLLQKTIPKGLWGQYIAGVKNRPVLRTQLIELLGEEEFDTKLKLVSYEGTVDPERILPAVLLHRIPIGLRGLLLVALLAASMSTFDTQVNMATGFFTRDLYQRYARPAASNRELIFASYGFGLAMVVAGFGLASLAENINDIWGWIIMSLTAGLAVPAILRLYWWRFNAGGVVASSVVGLSVPFLQRFVYPDMHEWYQFLIVTGVTLAAAVIGTFLTPPTDPHILQRFYKITRPFGFWGRLKAQLPPALREQVTRENRNDMLAVPFVMATQVSLYMLPMQLVIREWDDFMVTLVIFTAGLLGTYRFWYKNLPPAREGVATEEEIDAGRL